MMMMTRFLVATEEPLAADPIYLKVCVHVGLTDENSFHLLLFALDWPTVGLGCSMRCSDHLEFGFLLASS